MRNNIHSQNFQNNEQSWNGEALNQNNHPNLSYNNYTSIIQNNSYNSNHTKNRSTSKKKDNNKASNNFPQFAQPSEFLEEMYKKYSKSLQRYFIQNREGMKLSINKYFQRLSVDEFIKERKNSQKKYLEKIKNNNINNFNENNNVYEKINNSFTNNYFDEDFFLTPLPNKSRKLLNTDQEKNDFLSAERQAVIMRTFEYSYGVRSKFGINEYKKMLEEHKKQCFNIMINAANKIKNMWKIAKKNSIKKKQTFDVKYKNIEQNFSDLIMKKKLFNFINKLKNYVLKENKNDKKKFFKKIKSFSKNKIKKIYYLHDWINNLKINKNIKFSILSSNKIKKIEKNSYGFLNNFFLTKSIYFENCNDDSENNKKSAEEQIKKITFLQKFIKNFINYKKIKDFKEEMNKNIEKESFGFIKEQSNINFVNFLKENNNLKKYYSNGNGSNLSVGSIYSNEENYNLNNNNINNFEYKNNNNIENEDEINDYKSSEINYNNKNLNNQKTLKKSLSKKSSNSIENKNLEYPSNNNYEMDLKKYNTERYSNKDNNNNEINKVNVNYGSIKKLYSINNKNNKLDNYNSNPQITNYNTQQSNLNNNKNSKNKINKNNSTLSNKSKLIKPIPINKENNINKDIYIDRHISMVSKKNIKDNNSNEESNINNKSVLEKKNTGKKNINRNNSKSSFNVLGENSSTGNNTTQGKSTYIDSVNNKDNKNLNSDKKKNNSSFNNKSSDKKNNKIPFLNKKNNEFYENKNLKNSNINNNESLSSLKHSDEKDKNQINSSVNSNNIYYKNKNNLSDNNTSKNNINNNNLQSQNYKEPLLNNIENNENYKKIKKENNSTKNNYNEEKYDDSLNNDIILNEEDEINLISPKPFLENNINNIENNKNDFLTFDNENKENNLNENIKYNINSNDKKNINKNQINNNVNKKINKENQNTKFNNNKEESNKLKNNLEKNNQINKNINKDKINYSDNKTNPKENNLKQSIKNTNIEFDNNNNQLNIKNNELNKNNSLDAIKNKYNNQNNNIIPNNINLYNIEENNNIDEDINDEENDEKNNNISLNKQFINSKIITPIKENNLINNINSSIQFEDSMNYLSNKDKNDLNSIKLEPNNINNRNNKEISDNNYNSFNSNKNIYSEYSSNNSFNTKSKQIMKRNKSARYSLQNQNNLTLLNSLIPQSDNSNKRSGSIKIPNFRKSVSNSSFNVNNNMKYILGANSFFNFFHRPYCANSSCYISKIRKNIFSNNLKEKIIQIINIKKNKNNNNVSRKLFKYFNLWKNIYKDIIKKNRFNNNNFYISKKRKKYFCVDIKKYLFNLTENYFKIKNKNKNILLKKYYNKWKNITFEKIMLKPFNTNICYVSKINRKYFIKDLKKNIEIVFKLKNNKNKINLTKYLLKWKDLTFNDYYNIKKPINDNYNYYISKIRKKIFSNEFEKNIIRSLNQINKINKNKKNLCLNKYFQIWKNSAFYTIFNYITKPLKLKNNNMITKIRKKFFSNDVKKKLIKIINLKIKQRKIKINKFLNKWKELVFFIFNKPILSNNCYLSKIRKLNSSKSINSKLKNYFKLKSQQEIKSNNLNLKKYFNLWKRGINIQKKLFKILQKMTLLNKKLYLSKYFNKWNDNIYDISLMSCSYTHNITSISSVTDRSEHFSYYCKINKSNNENDFLTIRMCLGYKLLRRLFTRNLEHEFLKRLRKKNRRKNKSRTYYYNHKQTKVHLELLNFNIKLLYTLNKIIYRKFGEQFYHRLLYTALNKSKNIEYNLENNKMAHILQEGYKKGYFTILYNILKFRFNYIYYDTGLNFNDFIKLILNAKIIG